MTSEAQKWLHALLARAPVLPILSFDDLAAARSVAEALAAGGLTVIEVTLRSANALKILEAMAKVKGVTVGAGTVRRTDQIRDAEAAGAQFLVSPGAPPGLLAAARGAMTPLLPGVSTATEAMAAAEAGFALQKFFPAEAVGGAAAVKALAAPLPDITFCPTGGIDAAKAPAYLALPNVVCVGGSWVAPLGAIAARDFKQIEALARQASALKPLS